jgi:hypothetical protein
MESNCRSLGCVITLGIIKRVTNTLLENLVFGNLEVLKALAIEICMPGLI